MPHTFPCDLTLEEPILEPTFQPSGSPSGDLSSLPPAFPSNLPLEAVFSYTLSAPIDSPIGYPSIFPGPDPTSMFQKSLQKYQMALPIIAASLSCALESAVLPLDFLNILLQDAPSAYPADIPS